MLAICWCGESLPRSSNQASGVLTKPRKNLSKNYLKRDKFSPGKESKCVWKGQYYPR